MRRISKKRIVVLTALLLVALSLAAQTAIPSNTSLTSSPNPSKGPSPVTLTATVKVVGGNPAGTVEFFDGTSSLSLPVALGPSSKGFLDQTTYLLSGRARIVKVADVNGDGKSDLIVGTMAASPTPASIRILTGKGDGTFNSPVTYTLANPTGCTASTPTSVATGDFNADGKLDIAITDAGNGTCAGVVWIGLNDGGTTLKPLVGVTVGIAPSAAVTGDYNKDGKLDIAVANFGRDIPTSTVTLLTGKADGTFTATTIVAPALESPIAMERGDFNADTNPDLAVVNFGSGSTASKVVLLQGAGNGTFTNPASVNVGVAPVAIASADFNTDLRSDLVVPNSGSNSISVLLATGNNAFSVTTIPLVSDWTASRTVRQGDVVFPSTGNAGRYRFQAANDGTTGTAAPTWPQTVGNNVSDGTVTWQNIGIPLSPQHVAIADLDKDGKLDIAEVSGTADTVGIISGNGNGTFASTLTFLKSGPNTVQVAAGNFSGGGLHDLAVANLGTNSSAGTLTGVSVGVFLDAGVAQATKTIPDGLTSALASGSHSLSAKFTSTSTSVADSTSNTVTHHVDAVATLLLLSSSPNPSKIGTPVTLTATVSHTDPDVIGGKSGIVTFYESDTAGGGGTKTLGTGTVINNQAKLILSNLASGTHQLFAQYSGDPYFESSSSDTLQQTVTSNVPTVTTLNSSDNPSNVGVPITFTATVVPASGAGSPTGTVTFLEGNTPLPGGQNIGLDGGVARFTISTLTPGTHYITASYNGDNNFSASSSGPLAQQIQQSNSFLTLTSSFNPALPGTVVFTATVAGVTGTQVPTGIVKFTRDYDTAHPVQVPLANGIATLPVSYSPSDIGNHVVTAVYLGNSNYSPSNVGLVVQVISTTVVSSSALDFGGVPVGKTSQPQSIAVINPTGSTVGGVNISTTAPYTQQNNCGSSRPAFSICVVTVSFKPTVLGPSPGTLSISPSILQPNSVSLYGSGVNSLLTAISPTFPDVPVGRFSVSMSVDITNSSNSNITLGALSSTGDYEVYPGSCALMFTVAPGFSCNIWVSFVPKAGGTRPGSAILNYVGPGSPFILPLTGNAINALRFFPEIVDFGLQTYPAVATRTFTVKNEQTVPVLVTQITNSDPQYTTTVSPSCRCPDTSCVMRIPSKETCFVEETFTPTSIGIKPNIITFISDAAPGAHSLTALAIGDVPFTPSRPLRPTRGQNAPSTGNSGSTSGSAVTPTRNTRR